MLKKIVSIIMSIIFLTNLNVLVFGVEGVNVTTGSIGGARANIVYINMKPGRVGEVGLANGSVVSTAPVGNIINSQNSTGKLVASVNGGYFNAYYTGSGTHFPDNCPRLYATVMQENQILNGGGNSKLPTIGFTKDGTAIMDWTALTPMVSINEGERTFSTWGVNSYFTDNSAIMHFTPQMTLTVPLTADAKMAVVEDGVVTRVSQGESISLKSNMHVLAFRPGAYAQPPEVGDKVSFYATREPQRSEDSQIWDNVINAISVGPMLVNSGKNVANQNPDFTEANQQPDKVTLKGFVGVMNDGRVIMGTVTASNNSIANYLVSIGCKDAMSLDGGASTMLYVNGRGYLQSGGRNFSDILSIVDRYDIPTVEKIYDHTNEVHLNFDSERLNEVHDSDSAVSLIESVVSAMSEEEKNSVTAKDELAYLAEKAAARAETIEVNGDINIDSESVDKALESVSEAKTRIGSLLSSNGLSIRSIKSVVRIKTSKSSNININKEQLSSNADIIEVAMPFANVEIDNESSMEVNIENVAGNKIKVDFARNDTNSKVKVKFPGIKEDKFQAVSDEEGNVLVSKYDTVTDEISAKLNDDETVSLISNYKAFSDIKTQNARVYDAINNLAAKGIIAGTSETEFSPEKSITRAEIAALIIRMMNEDDPNADGGFADVSKSDWFFGVAGVSKRENIIAGYEDNTFRGKVVIPNVQITSLVARVLKNELGYYCTDASILSKFKDNNNIPQWALEDVALATYANMYVGRSDNNFVADTDMTRGDAAVIMEMLYYKMY